MTGLPVQGFHTTDLDIMRTFKRGFSPAYSAVATAIRNTSPVAPAPPADTSAFSGSLAGIQFTGNRSKDIQKLWSIGLGVKEAQEIVDKLYAAQENIRYAGLDSDIDQLFGTWVGSGKFTEIEVTQRFSKYFNIFVKKDR